VKLRKDAVARQKLLGNILPTAKSLSSGLVKLRSWLDEADVILASHCICGELAAVVERLNKHKVCFLSVLVFIFIACQYRLLTSSAEMH